MNEDRLNVPSYLERFFRAFDVKGPLPDAFLPVTQVGVTLADLTLFEYGWLRRESGYIGGDISPAVAGAFSGLQLANPTVGTKLAYDIYLTINNPTAASLDCALLCGAYVLNIGTDISTKTQVRDTRQRAGTAFAGPASCVVYRGSDPIGMGVTAMPFTVPASSKQVLGPFNLAPNTGLTAERTTVNLALSGYFTWRERDLEATEY